MSEPAIPIVASSSEPAAEEQPVADELHPQPGSLSRWVDVAVDAAGPGGGQLFSYHVPDRLHDLSAGEAVLVEYGRRQAVAVVVAERDSDPGRPTKPVLARVRSDGPLLPPLQLDLALHISRHYLAPPALVVRQMLPPGLLERVELVARATGRSVAADPLLTQLASAGPGELAVDDLPRSAGRATLLRELHRLEGSGSIELEWRVRPAAAADRLERRVSLTADGTSVTGALERGEPVAGRPLGARQQALLGELLAAGEPLS
ncbi:MAG: hypothetical protein M3253_08145, partial [Chloroflexota bacterium]|nr:hypothetical protein [Chloroflexota bacterium]